MSRQKHTPRYFSLETRRKISEGNRRRYSNPLERKKTSDALKGKMPKNIDMLHSPLIIKKRAITQSGEGNPMWKGENVSYAGLHMWVRKCLGNPKYCEHCGTTKKRMYHWSNVSGKYRRDLSDWIRLCVPCHSKFDRTKS
jgi:hypothetical protein